MSTRGWDERVKDILDAIDEIDAFTAGMERETFCDADQATPRRVRLRPYLPALSQAQTSVITPACE